MSKQCSKCKRKKKLEEFHKKASSKDGLAPFCKMCKRQIARAYYVENADHVKAKSSRYRRDFPEKCASVKRASYEKKREEYLQRHREGYEANREERLRQAKEYRTGENRERYLEGKRRHNKSKKGHKTYRSWIEANRERVRSKQNKRRKIRRDTDPAHRITVCLRNRLRKLIIRDQRSGSAVRDLGCSVEELKRHLESKFNSRMNWKNWGTYWHIDHFFPLAEADLEDRVEFLAVNNWRNLQPLTSPENLKKGDTVYPEARELFEKLKAEFAREAAA